MIKAILFDLDGVLVDSYLAWFALFNQTLNHFGFPGITEAVFRRHWGQSTEEDVRIFMPGRKLDEIRDYFLVRFIDFVDQVIVNPQAIQVLDKLSKRGLKLGCITNSHREIVNAVLGSNRLDCFFKVILTADDLPPKPAPDMLVKACDHLEVTPAQTVFVGDTATDIKAAEAAGCAFVGYRFEAGNKITALKDLLSLTLEEIGI
jgi:HAD superfamily hydrolase (TIGR01509 family)